MNLINHSLISSLGMLIKSLMRLAGFIALPVQTLLIVMYLITMKKIAGQSDSYPELPGSMKVFSQTQ